MDMRALGMGLLFALIWSSAFTSARMIVADAPPLWALVLRFALSGVIGVAVARAMGQTWALTRGQWRAVIVFGICQNALYLGLNFIAMQRVEAGLAAIIASTMPLLVAAANWVWFRERLSSLGMLGLLAGFAGVSVIMTAHLDHGPDNAYVLLCVLAAFALTLATLTMRGTSGGEGNVMMIVGLQLLVGSVALLPFALIFEDFAVNLTGRLIGAFLYTTLAPGLFATWIWFLLVARIGATRAATYHFLNPFFGVAIAAILLGEALSLRDVIGVAIIAAGILAVQMSRIAGQAQTKP